MNTRTKSLVVKLLQIVDYRDACQHIDMYHFDDNGDYPDGNSLLCQLDGFSDSDLDDIETAIAINSARIVIGYNLNDREVGTLISGLPYDLDIDAEAVEALYDLTCDALENTDRVWSHYGAWNTLDSYWLVVA